MTYSDTFFVILLFDLLLIALLKAFYWKITKQLFLSIFAQRYANQYLREENVFAERATILITVIMLINLSLFLSKMIFGINLSPYNFSKIFIWISVVFLIKTLVIHLLGYIFILKSLAKLSIYFSFLFDRALGITLFPVIVFMFFSSISTSVTLYIISLGIMLFFLLIKMYWILKIGIVSFGLSKYYLFLYLCTLEILPLLLIIKVVFY